METIGFVLKKVVSRSCYPLGLTLLMLIVGLLLSRNGSRARIGLGFILSATVILWVMSMPITSYVLVRSLETRAGKYADPVVLAGRGVRHVAVLGVARIVKGLTPADAYGIGLARVMEGIRLWKELPKAQLILSGPGFYPEFSDPETMRALPLKLGVPRESIVIVNKAFDTEDEARLIAGIVGKKEFALVTSAMHMPRSLKHFRRYGMNPIPAPCRFRSAAPPRLWDCWIPSSDALASTKSGVHEYLGSAWAFIKTESESALIGRNKRQ